MQTFRNFLNSLRSDKTERMSKPTKRKIEDNNETIETNCSIVF